MYLNPKTLSNQSHYAPGLIELTPEQEQVYIHHNGFVTVSQNEDGAYVITPDENRWNEWKKGQPNPLIQQKETLITKSKKDLEAYLLNNPLQWTDGNYYSITAEKQAQLTSKIIAATMAQTLSQPYTLTWNSTGDVCTEWELADLYALAFAIDARVTALVGYQQVQEVAIRNAGTKEELDAIVIDYDSVGTNNESKTTK